MNSHPSEWGPSAPAAGADTPSSRHLRHLLTTLASSSQRNILLRVEPAVMDACTLFVIERFLRSPACQRVLLLVPPRCKAALLEQWEHAIASDDGRPLKEHITLTAQPQHAQAAQVCLATVLDIQRLSVPAMRTFCTIFDAMLVYAVPASPGPGWNYVVGSVVASEAWVIGVSSTLSQEEGEALFAQVIDGTTSNDEPT